MSDTSKTIVRSASFFLSGTFLSRVSGLLRDVAMAFAFGTSSSIAALMVAFRFAHLFRRILGEGAMQSAFIPKFEEMRRESKKRALQFFCDLALLLSLALFLLTLAAVAALFFAYRWVASQGAKEILFLTIILMPSLFFICLYGLNSALLQCEKIYFLPSAAPVAFNLVWVAGTLLFSPYGAEEATLYLAGAIAIACGAQWLMTLPAVLQIVKGEGALFSLKTLFRNRGVSDDILQLLTPLSLGIAGVAAAQVNSALDPLFARIADPEGPAYLWYAMRLQQLPLSLFGVAFSSALFPPLARAAKKGDSASFRYFLALAVKRCTLFILPATFAYFALAESCVSALFGIGDFGSRSILCTSKALTAYSAGLLPSCLVILLAPAFYALGDYRTPALATAASVALNCSLNSLFVIGLGLGASAVALATSIAAWLNFAILFALLSRRCGAFLGSEEWILAIRAAAVSLLSAAAASVVDGSLFAEAPKLLRLAASGAAFSLPCAAWMAWAWRYGQVD